MSSTTSAICARRRSLGRTSGAAGRRRSRIWVRVSGRIVHVGVGSLLRIFDVDLVRSVLLIQSVPELHYCRAGAGPFRSGSAFLTAVSESRTCLTPICTQYSFVSCLVRAWEDLGQWFQGAGMHNTDRAGGTQTQLLGQVCKSLTAHQKSGGKHAGKESSHIRIVSVAGSERK